MTSKEYIITPDGLVHRNNKTLKYDINSKGYARVSLHGKRFFVHRLVAKKYIPNPNNLPQVNHINGDKLNNSVDNLEWCDNTYNNKHSYLNGRCSGNTKLSKEALQHIINVINSGNYNVKELAVKYNVAVSTIYAIKQGFNRKRLLN